MKAPNIYYPQEYKIPPKPQEVGKWDLENLISDLNSYLNYSKNKINAKKGLWWVLAAVSLYAGTRKENIERIIEIAQEKKSGTLSHLINLRLKIESCYHHNPDGELGKRLAKHYWRLVHAISLAKTAATATSSPSTVAESKDTNGRELELASLKMK